MLLEVRHGIRPEGGTGCTQFVKTHQAVPSWCEQSLYACGIFLRIPGWWAFRSLSMNKLVVSPNHYDKQTETKHPLKFLECQAPGCLRFTPIRYYSWGWASGTHQLPHVWIKLGFHWPWRREDKRGQGVCHGNGGGGSGSDGGGGSWWQ